MMRLSLSLPVSFLMVFLFCKALLASDEVALLKAIEDHPAEDTPRLVYADYLQEHGQAERAHFIRLQVELARADPFTERYEELVREERPLRVNAKKWLPEKLRGLTVKWERGFPMYVYAPADSLADADFRKALESLPMLKELGISSHRGHLSNLARLKNLPHFTALSLVDSLTEEDVDDLAALKMEGLRRLSLVRADSAGLLRLENSWLAPRLTHFEYRQADLGQIRAIANSSKFGNLLFLNLYHADPAELVGRTGLPQLKAVEIAVGEQSLHEGRPHTLATGFRRVRAFVQTPEFRSLSEFRLKIDAGVDVPSAEKQTKSLFNLIAKQEHSLVVAKAKRDIEWIEVPAKLTGQLEKNQTKATCSRVVLLLSES